jgi:hypothetical protein
MRFGDSRCFEIAQIETNQSARLNFNSLTGPDRASAAKRLPDSL